ncbi:MULTISPECIES: MFS transporter [Staphylococcus]|uniref:MFS transporter n=1 Tax=Staphylococcus TaxID=1279 RepID=UPI0021D04377|nr:MFS transporter [Staphylococcus sp. IVB6181]UXV34069.1 MFS transporter [Staphylococcus sp. IVB6181]
MNIKSINLLLFDVISSVGSKIFSFACAFYILHTTQTSAMYSIFLALIVISTVLSQPIFGVLTDKYNNKRIIFVSQIINVIALIIFIPLYQSFFHYILIIGIILNLTDGAISLVVNANIKNISQNDMERFISLRQSYNLAISILSPIIGGFLIAFIHIKYLAMLNVATEAIAILIMYFLTIDRVTVSNNNNSMFSDFKEGLAYLLRNNTFIRFMMIGVILNFLVNAVIVGVPVISIQTWHISSEQFGIVESATTIGMFSMSLLLSVFPIKKKLKGPFQISMLLMFFSILFLGVSLLIQPNPFQGFIILFLVYLINGIALPLTNIPYSIFLQTYIDENYKGRVLSLNQSIVLCITPLSLLIFGFLLNYTQAGLFIAIAVFVFIILCYFTVAFKKDENLQ